MLVLSACLLLARPQGQALPAGIRRLSESGSGDAYVGITIEYFSTTDCSNRPTYYGYAEPAEGEPPYSGAQCATPAGTCGDDCLGWQGSCPSVDTTEHMYYNLFTDSVVRDGLEYQMLDDDCETSYDWSAFWDHSWVPGSCRTCMQMFGDDCPGSTKALKISCGELEDTSTGEGGGGGMLFRIIVPVAGGVLALGGLAFHLTKKSKVAQVQAGSA